MQECLVLSRYSIDRVFRPRKLDRAHPRELLECAFDIITPVTNSLLPDAEAIYAISEIIQEFPSLQVSHLNCFVWFFFLDASFVHHCPVFSHGTPCFFRFNFPCRVPNIPEYLQVRQFSPDLIFMS